MRQTRNVSVILGALYCLSTCMSIRVAKRCSNRTDLRERSYVWLLIHLPSLSGLVPQWQISDRTWRHSAVWVWHLAVIRLCNLGRSSFLWGRSWRFTNIHQLWYVYVSPFSVMSSKYNISLFTASILLECRTVARIQTDTLLCVACRRVHCKYSYLPYLR